ncbi:hypothetical protein L5515_018296 [Caenorhabditis briggsae]|uniref:Uncharacterized protein n=1 Tax=Caenorhabditis briggsae TaxID=6238 RepID=A0AAE9FGK1_CAEBR|nr:hypothetical protein L5515_018296 [Caenorhabditis briggsae]
MLALRMTSPRTSHHSTEWRRSGLAGSQVSGSSRGTTEDRMFHHLGSCGTTDHYFLCVIRLVDLFQQRNCSLFLSLSLSLFQLACITSESNC